MPKITVSRESFAAEPQVQAFIDRVKLAEGDREQDISLADLDLYLDANPRVTELNNRDAFNSVLNAVLREYQARNVRLPVDTKLSMFATKSASPFSPRSNFSTQAQNALRDFDARSFGLSDGHAGISLDDILKPGADARGWWYAGPIYTEAAWARPATAERTQQRLQFIQQLVERGEWDRAVNVASAINSSAGFQLVADAILAQPLTGTPTFALLDMVMMRAGAAAQQRFVERLIEFEQTLWSTRRLSDTGGTAASEVIETVGQKLKFFTRQVRALDPALREKADRAIVRDRLAASALLMGDVAAIETYDLRHPAEGLKRDLSLVRRELGRYYLKTEDKPIGVGSKERQHGDYATINERRDALIDDMRTYVSMLSPEERWLVANDIGTPLTIGVFDRDKVNDHYALSNGVLIHDDVAECFTRVKPTVRVDHLEEDLATYITSATSEFVHWIESDDGTGEGNIKVDQVAFLLTLPDFRRRSF